MKKKILLALAIISMLACLFALSVSAEEVNPDYNEQYVKAMTQGMLSVELEDGSSVDLYDEQGYTLCYYWDDATSASRKLLSVRTKDLKFNFSGTKLSSIYYGDEHLAGTAQAGKIVVLNLRGVTNGNGQDITDFSSDNMFKESSPLQHIFMPDTIEHLIGYAFGHRDGTLSHLRGCYFSENSQLQEIQSNTFSNARQLRGFYMPKGVTYIGSNGFQGCNNAFFVNNAYDFLTKPDVYYFPEGLNKIEGETFKFCYKMNDTIVFGTGITNVPNAWALAFNDSVARNVVFLGQFTSFEASNQVKNTSFYFANKNVSLTPKDGGSNNKFYFCSEGSTHLYLVNETLAADCENNAKTQTRCFCGAVDASSLKEEENTALGHDHDYIDGKATLLAIVYDDYSKAGTKTVKCGNCGKENSEIVAAAIFTYKGYSKNDKGGFCIGYNIDQVALKEYEALNKTTIVYGFAASANNVNPLNANGEETENSIKAELTKSTYTAADFVLTSKDWTAENVASAKLSINMYVIVNNAVKYITANGCSDTAEAKAYSEI